MLIYTEPVEVVSKWLKPLRDRSGNKTGEEAQMIDVIDGDRNRVPYRLSPEFAANGVPDVGEKVCLVVNVRTFANAKNSRDGKAYIQYVQDYRAVGTWDGKAVTTAKVANKKAA